MKRGRWKSEGNLANMTSAGKCYSPAGKPGKRNLSQVAKVNSNSDKPCGWHISLI